MSVLRPYSLNPKARSFAEGQRRIEADARGIALNAMYPVSTAVPPDFARLLDRLDRAV